MKDLFDQFVEELDAEDPFKQTKSSEEESISTIKSQLVDLLSKFDEKDRQKQNEKIKADFADTIKRELAKIKPVQNIIEKTVVRDVPVHLEPKVVKSPPQIIKEVRVEVQKENDSIPEFKKQLEEFKRKFDEIEKALMFSTRGGSGVIGIPPPEGNPNNYVLTIVNGKPKWAVATGGSGGLTPGTFSVTNNTPVFTFDPTTSTIDTLYQTVATLIRKLQGEI